MHINLKKKKNLKPNPTQTKTLSASLSLLLSVTMITRFLLYIHYYCLSSGSGAQTSVRVTAPRCHTASTSHMLGYTIWAIPRPSQSYSKVLTLL